MAEPTASDRAVAVVLAPPGSEGVAVRALSVERPWRVLAVSDPLLAMAEIALAAQAAKTRESLQVEGEASDDDAVAFVLAHPQKWAIRHELIEAITQYFPATRLFAFDERGLQEAKQRRTAKPKARRGGENGQGDSPRPPARPDSAANSISREEIDMLLGGESR